MIPKPGDIVRVKSRDLIFGGVTEEVEEDELLLILDFDDVDERIVNVFHPNWGTGWMTLEHLEVVSEA